VWVCLRVCCVDVGEVVSSRLLFVMWYLCVCVYVYACVCERECCLVCVCVVLSQIVSSICHVVLFFM